MAGKKDNAVVMVLADVTTAQAAQVAKEVIRIKNKFAPLGRGTIATGKRQDVGGLLQKGIQNKISGK
ncbi:MAG: hypothetical protein K2N44_12565 [Lachnospiraceae bacterium]|nr:hypothetical protein [Lachnospiraceae bacterium]